MFGSQPLLFCRPLLRMLRRIGPALVVGDLVILGIEGKARAR